MSRGQAVGREQAGRDHAGSGDQAASSHQTGNGDRPGNGHQTGNDGPTANSHHTGNGARTESAVRGRYGRLFRLDGRRVAVVGGAGGIGREAVRALVAQGADVLVVDRDADGAAETARLADADADGTEADAEAGSVRGSAWPVALDVLDEAAVAAAAADWGALDGLVVTVGVNVRKRISDYAMEEFDRVVALNLRAHFGLVRACAPAMAGRGRGSVVSLASMRAFQVEPGQGAYAASKAGLVQLLRTAAAEWGPAGVRFNAIAPGVVRTPLTDQIAADPAWYDAYAQASALKRWAGAEEIAGAVVYLVSDASTFVTGSVLTVDGGWTAVDGRYDPSV